MDTPFGRLDRQHDNIMRFVPTLADQVALLVHSGEIDPARDLKPVEGKVTAEFEIPLRLQFAKRDQEARLMSTEKDDLKQVGASQKSRDVLESLQEAGYISDFLDGYRLAIAPPWALVANPAPTSTAIEKPCSRWVISTRFGVEGSDKGDLPRF